MITNVKYSNHLNRAMLLHLSAYCKIARWRLTEFNPIWRRHNSYRNLWRWQRIMQKINHKRPCDIRHWQEGAETTKGHSTESEQWGHHYNAGITQLLTEEVFVKQSSSLSINTGIVSNGLKSMLAKHFHNRYEIKVWKPSSTSMNNHEKMPVSHNF